jgi:hypothetical protein
MIIPQVPRGEVHPAEQLVGPHVLSVLSGPISEEIEYLQAVQKVCMGQPAEGCRFVGYQQAAECHRPAVPRHMLNVLLALAVHVLWCCPALQVYRFQVAMTAAGMAAAKTREDGRTARGGHVSLASCAVFLASLRVSYKVL